VVLARKDDIKMAVSRKMARSFPFDIVVFGDNGGTRREEVIRSSMRHRVSGSEVLHFNPITTIFPECSIILKWGRPFPRFSANSDAAALRTENGSEAQRDILADTN